MSWRKAFHVSVISVLLLGAFVRPSAVIQEKALPKMLIDKHLATSYTVCSSGCDFNSIQTAINSVSAGDTLNLAAEIFTENITLNKSLTILGAGAESTIVQAAAAPGVATSRVVTISSGVNASIGGITVRHGVANGDWPGSYGGGIYIPWQAESLILNNCKVVDNFSSSSGGGIFNQSNLEITNSYIGNNATLYNGGGIYNSSELGLGILTINNSTITNNQANFKGGGVYSYGWENSLTLIETDINFNFINDATEPGDGGKGGGIYMQLGNLNIFNSSITNNQTGKGYDVYSGSDGAGIYLDQVTANIENSTISENTAGDGGNANKGGDGGGIYNNQGKLNIVNSTISDNNAGNDSHDCGSSCGGGNGGGLYNYQGTLIITNSTISSNQAGQSTYTGGEPVGIGSGGGFYNNRGSIRIFDAQIVGNFAGDGVSCDLMNCEAANGGLGGGIYNQGSLAIRNSTISDNRAGNGGDCTGNNCWGGNGGSGGGLYYSGFSGQSLIIESSEFKNNFTGDEGNCTGTSCKDGEAGNGGGFYNDSSSLNSTLSIVTLQNNQANNGGGIFNQGFLTLTHSIAISNTASNGGGILNEGIGFVTDKGLYISDSFFSFNVAEYGGGGILNGSIENGGILEISSSTFSNNSAGDGGAIQNYSPDMMRVSLSISQSKFYANTAQNDGGAIHNYDGSNDPEVSAILDITNSAFSENMAGSNGGGIYNNLSWIFDPWYSQYIITPTIINTSFANNAAGIEGGGIYSSGLGPILENTIFWDNSAAFNGPQIYNYSSTPEIAYSDIQGSGGSGPGWDNNLGTDAGGNIDADPLFVDYTAHDLRLYPASPAIDSGDNNVCPVTDLDGNPRPYGPVCDMGAFEFYPLNLGKSANQSTPWPGEIITFTIQITNNLTETITGGLISDTLPVSLNFIGPITLEPPLSGTIGSVPPTLVTNLEIAPSQQITLTFPVSVVLGLEDGTEITNTASVNSNQVTIPIYGSITLVVNNKIYLPLVMK